MDEVVYQNLLDNPKFFAPTDGHRLVEVSIPEGSQSAQVKITPIPERRLTSVWSSSGSEPAPAQSLRLLICAPRISYQNIWPLPVSSETLEELLSTLGIPSLFPRAICNHLPIATAFDTFSEDGRSGFLLRTNLTQTWQYALATVYDPRTQFTEGILLGMHPDEIDDLLESIRRSPASLTDSPVSLPCILIDKALDALVRDAEARRVSLIKICYDTGLHGFQRASFLGTWDDRDDLDLDVTMQKLTSLSDACAGISAVCKMQYAFIDVLEGFCRRQDHDRHGFAAAVAAGSSASASLPAPPPPAEGGDGRRRGADSIFTRRTQQRLRFVSHALCGVESKVLYVSASVQGQIQTIYALIGQRDSRSHLALAQTTRRLAELTQRDSTDMRTIAAVTLVFLPATFTATFFSTSFFNFQPSDPASHASPWLWLYWVLTLLLTAGVLAGWWMAARLQMKAAERAVRRESRGKEEAWELRSGTLGDGGGEGGGGGGSTGLSRVDAVRPYLSGSVSEGVFARRVSLPFDGPKRADTGDISPTATHHNSVAWAHANKIPEE